MRTDMRQRKHARAGLRALSGEQQWLGGPDPRAPLGQAGARRTRPWEQPSVGTYDLTRLVGTTLPVARATGRTQLETVASVLATPSRSACRWWCRGYRNRWPSVAEDPFYCTAQRKSNDAAAACWLGTVSPWLQLALALLSLWSHRLDRGASGRERDR